MNENIYNIFIDKGLISLTYQKLKQIRKKREKKEQKNGQRTWTVRWQTKREKQTTDIPEMPYNITYKIKNGNEKGFFFNRSAKKKNQSLLTLVLLRVWGKTLVWIGAMCIKKKTVLLGTYPALKHPRRQVNCPSILTA